MDFYYPNLQNDMWRIIGFVFYGDKDYFLTDTKKAIDKILVLINFAARHLIGAFIERLYLLFLSRC